MISEAHHYSFLKLARKYSDKKKSGDQMEVFEESKSLGKKN